MVQRSSIRYTVVMPENPTVQVRLTPDELAKVDAFAETLEGNRSMALRALLRRGMAVDIDRAPADIHVGSGLGRVGANPVSTQDASKHEFASQSANLRCAVCGKWRSNGAHL